MSTQYESTVRTESALYPGVCFLVERMSFGRRIELMKAIREASIQFEFHAADKDVDKMKIGLLAAEVDRIYVRWGLRGLHGIAIDGEPATPDALAASGPEDLFLEALSVVKQHCGLSETEKKT